MKLLLSILETWLMDVCCTFRDDCVVSPPPFAKRPPPPAFRVCYLFALDVFVVALLTISFLEYFYRVFSIRSLM